MIGRNCCANENWRTLRKLNENCCETNFIILFVLLGLRDSG